MKSDDPTEFLDRLCSEMSDLRSELEQARADLAAATRSLIREGADAEKARAELASLRQQAEAAAPSDAVLARDLELTEKTLERVCEERKQWEVRANEWELKSHRQKHWLKKLELANKHRKQEIAKLRKDKNDAIVAIKAQRDAAMALIGEAGAASPISVEEFIRNARPAWKGPWGHYSGEQDFLAVYFEDKPAHSVQCEGGVMVQLGDGDEICGITILGLKQFARDAMRAQRPAPAASGALREAARRVVAANEPIDDETPFIYHDLKDALAAEPPAPSAAAGVAVPKDVRKVSELWRSQYGLGTEARTVADFILSLPTAAGASQPEPAASGALREAAKELCKDAANAIVDYGEEHDLRDLTKSEAACRTALAGTCSAFDLTEHLRRQSEWSARTFGPDGDHRYGLIDHVMKELVEVGVAENKDELLAEWIDVVILGLDGCWRAGFTPEQIVAALAAKQTKNESRKWPDWRTAEPGKAIEHDRSQDQHDNDRPQPGSTPT